MNFLTKTCPLNKVRTDCLIVSVYGDKSLSTAAKVLEADNGCISQLINLGDLKLSAGKCAWITPSKESGFKRLLVVCVGDKSKSLDSQSIKLSATAVASALKSKKIKSASWSVENSSDVSDHKFATIIAEAITTSLYSYSETKTQNLSPPILSKLTLHSSDKLSSGWKNGLKEGLHLGEGINYTRELGNLPANICTPSYLAKQAQTLKSKELSVKVLDEKQLEKLGMGSFLSVGHGSDEPSKFIVMEYKGTDKSKRPTVLVGKGVTFDTGGISLKPGAAMDEMKYDMCGAATVFGVMKTISQLSPKVNVVAIIAAAENMPSGRATKPGDVVTSMSGQTIEVLNTDAEGRLVLCDALTYAERFKPDAVIDIATLTGACVVALGRHASGLYANDQALADKLLAAGNEAQDKAWQMPLWDEYQKQLDSNFADIANIGGREAGSVTAACFLSRFTKAYKWAHIDIAGTAWLGGAAKGATGRPVGLLVNYILNKR